MSSHKAPPTQQPAFPFTRPGGGGHGRHLRETAEKAKNTGNTLLKLWKDIRRKSGLLGVSLLAVCIATLLNLLAPYLLGLTIDRYLLPGVDPVGLGQMAIVIAATYLLHDFFTFLQHQFMISLSQQVVGNLRKKLFHKYQELGLAFFDSRPHGELMSRLTSDIEAISNVLSNSLLQFISGLLSLGGIIVMMFLINPFLALVCIGLLPLVVLITRLIARGSRGGFQKYQQYLGQLNGLTEENISNMRIVSAFCRHEKVLRDFKLLNDKLRRSSLRANIFAGFMGPVMNLLSNLNFAVTAFAGGLLTLGGQATIGTIAIFLNYTKQFSRPLNHLAQQYNTLQAALAGAERVYEILSQPSEFETSEKKTAQSGTGIKGTVVFSDVNFSYTPGVRILEDINIQAEAGQTIALVGPTGAGKTTLINLLTRFYDLDKGKIMIDGRDLASWPKQILRRQLGIVLQDTFLFSTSIMENIRFGRLSASCEEVIQAAELAHADTFIRQMPEGFLTFVAEGGANLSHGQRQLLAIARVILAAPAILILDEATSSVDTRTELAIRHAMDNLMAGRTSFVIAHRLNTIRKADKILVIDKGKIIEEGTHTDLIGGDTFYRKLYMRE